MMRKLAMLMIAVSMISLPTQTRADSNLDSCKPIIDAADKALKSCDDVINLKGKAITAQDDIINAQTKEIIALQDDKNNILKNPLLYAILGIVAGGFLVRK